MCRTQPTWQAAFVGKEQREADTGLPPSRIRSEVQVSHSVVLRAVLKGGYEIYLLSKYMSQALSLCPVLKTPCEIFFEFLISQHQLLPNPLITAVFSLPLPRCNWINERPREGCVFL